MGASALDLSPLVIFAALYILQIILAKNGL